MHVRRYASTFGGLFVKPAGTVTARLGTRIVVVASDAGQLPPLYAEVADAAERPVGKIVDLYGSVAKPYISVLCDAETCARIEPGTELYVIAGTAPEHEKKKYRRYTKKQR